VTEALRVNGYERQPPHQREDRDDGAEPLSSATREQLSQR
jgi:hypothetical protein